MNRGRKESSRSKWMLVETGLFNITIKYFGEKNVLATARCTRENLQVSLDKKNTLDTVRLERTVSYNEQMSLLKNHS